MRKLTSLALAVTFIFICATTISCNDTKSKKDIKQDQNNVIDVSNDIVKYESDTILIGQASSFVVGQNNIYIIDAGATDYLVKAFDAKTGKYLGQFMKYGAGPNEISSPFKPDLIISEVDGREKMIEFDLGQFNAWSFDTDSALSSEEYLPHRINKISSSPIPVHYKHIDDTLGFANKVIIDKDLSYTQTIGRYNLSSGAFSDFSTDEIIEGNKTRFDIDRKRNLLVEVGSNIDRAIIYDLNGNVVRRMFGPEYQSKADKNKLYYSDVTITDKYILGVYSGEDASKSYLGKNVIVWDKEGNYIATLKTGRNIQSLSYHSPTDKLYMSFIGDEMQFGTLSLEAILTGTNRDESASLHSQEKSKEDREENTSKSAFNNESAPTPLAFFNNDLSEQITSIDLGEIAIPEKITDRFHAWKTDLNIRMLPTDVDTITLHQPVVTVPFIKPEHSGRTKFYRELLGFIYMFFDDTTPEGPFETTMTVAVDGYKEPARIHIIGTIVRKPDVTEF